MSCENCPKGSRCKECNSEMYRKRKAKYPEKFKQYSKTTRVNNLEKFKEKRRTVYIENREKELTRSREYFQKNKREIYLKNITKKFNITLDNYNKMWEDQNGLCKLCFSPPTEKQYLCIDHCHKTGKVRGLLCTTCNKALGLFKDNKELLLKAAKYLEDKDETKQ